MPTLFSYPDYPTSSGMGPAGALPHNSADPGKIRCLITQPTEEVKEMGVRQESKRELAEAQRRRYLKAGRVEKGRILDEFVAATGYERKWAMELLRHGPPPARVGRGDRPRVYSTVVVGALRVVVEASDWLCGKRLAPFLGERFPPSRRKEPCSSGPRTGSGCWA